MTETNAGDDAVADATLERKRAYNRTWREANLERVRAYNRQWKAEHPERSRELNRESMRRADAKRRRDRDRRKRSREYYAANAERLRIYNRAWRAARRAEDPEGYKRAETERRRRWRDENREHVTAYARAQQKADPASSRDRSREYVRRHREERNAAKQEYLRRHPEKRREYQTRWRAKDKWRRAHGLPTWQLHRTTPLERAANRFAADEFFARSYSAKQVRAIARGPVEPSPYTRFKSGERDPDRTPPELWVAWSRDCFRARADHAAQEDRELRERLDRELALRPPPPMSEAEIEDAWLDYVARAVNDRLRRVEPRRRPDVAAPHPYLQHQTMMGMRR